MKLIDIIRDSDFIEAGSDPEKLQAIIDRLSRRRRLNYISAAVYAGLFLVISLISYYSIFLEGEERWRFFAETLRQVGTPVFLGMSLVIYIDAIATGSKLKLLLFLSAQAQSRIREGESI